MAPFGARVPHAALTDMLTTAVDPGEGGVVMKTTTSWLQRVCVGVLGYCFCGCMVVGVCCILVVVFVVFVFVVVVVVVVVLHTCFYVACL